MEMAMERKNEELAVARKIIEDLRAQRKTLEQDKMAKMDVLKEVTNIFWGYAVTGSWNKCLHHRVVRLNSICSW
jgi:hypothetical protein